MAYSASVTVPGEAKGQPRPRAFSRDGKARVYDPGTADGFKSAIAAAFAGKLPAIPIEGAVAVTIAAYFTRPKSHRCKSGLRGNAPGRYIQKPDADNIAKAVLDALTTLGLWRDDAQVDPLTVRRAWTSGASWTEIDIEEAADVAA